MGFFDGGFGGLVSGALGAIGGLVGSGLDAAHDRDLARMNQNFQEKVYQNQIQWKAADAKKAGLHPLAALGGGSYSASNIASSGGTNYAGALGKLGEGIGDAFHAYMTKEERAAAVLAQQEREDRDKKQADANLRLTEAQIQEVSARAMETARRALGVNRPWLSGNEYMPGQVDSGAPSLLGGKVGDTYAVRPVGDGYYDINFSTDYQQEIGDELGQLVNALKSYTRAGAVPFTRDGRLWRNPETGDMYQYSSGKGYWRKMGWTE